MKTKTKLFQKFYDGAYFGDTLTMQREKERGNFWVLRNAAGEYLDHDQYRHDLAERHDIELKGATEFDTEY